MAKGDIACFEQFLLLSQCFQKLAAAEASESVFMRESDNHLTDKNKSAADDFESIVAKTVKNLYK